jgi:fatty-acyl-CoA synthase
MNQANFDVLERWAKIYPKSIALQDLDTGRSFSYLELYERAKHLAAVLKQEFQVGWGDRVALLATNEVETMFLFFALKRLGAILVPLNWRLTQRELQGLTADAEPKLFIYQDQFAETVQQLQSTALKLNFSGSNSLVSRIFSESLLSIENQSSLNDPCLILYTSGTTGTPKGALLTNKMIFWNAVSTGMRLEITRQDKTGSIFEKV